MNKKGLLLLSGGLDSVLSGKILQEQGIEISGFFVITPFFPLSMKKQQFLKVREMARWLKIPLKIKYLGYKYLKMVEHPEYGWGKGANPCIDCKIMMLKEAWNYAKEIKIGFLITGEVLGQRPMSQYLQALETIEKRAGVQSLVVRPLSAKLLPSTIPENSGIIDRDGLLSIEGRSRAKQMELANKWKLKGYSSPAGGCLLTDPIYAKRIKYLIGKRKLDKSMAHLSKVGRHFFLSSDTQLILGRDEKENQILENFSHRGILLEAQGIPSPIGLLINGEQEETAASILLGYTKFNEGEVLVKSGTNEKIIKAIAMPKMKSGIYLSIPRIRDS